jgi:TRAP-type uncharacterized transport system fused permease subunit
MGLPVTAAYIILAILTAPALAGILADSIIIDQLVAGHRRSGQIGVLHAG